MLRWGSSGLGHDGAISHLNTQISETLLPRETTALVCWLVQVTAEPLRLIKY
jgi:hypothetical protein